MREYRRFAILIFVLFFCIFYKVDASVNELPLLSKVIFVDPGHGGRDPGALYKDIHEADINLEISKILVKKLEEKGAIVYITRTGDYDLSSPRIYNVKRSDMENRVKIINNSNVDLYLSVHLNTIGSSKWSGAQVFYDDINEKNIKLAEVIQKSFNKFLGSKRKIKEITNLYMFRHIKVPGVLLEVGFLSNPNERYILRQKWYQEKVCNSIVNGVIEYYKKK